MSRTAPVRLVGGMPAVFAQDPDAWARKITALWRASVESIIRVGSTLNDAKKALPHGAFGAMIQSALPFSASTAQRLMAIAGDARLSNPAHVQLLPPSWGTLYELTKLSDDEFDSLLKKRIIRPDMERREIAERIRPHLQVLESGAAVAQDAVNVLVAGSNPASPAIDDQPEEIPPAEVPNGARAVMGSRHEATDSLDFFPTPPWATRALIEHVLFARFGFSEDFRFRRVWEPACGEGHIAKVLREYCDNVAASDIHDYGCDRTSGIIDFLSDAGNQPGFDWIITNPPFGAAAEAFTLKAIDLANIGVAMFVRVQWLDSIGRYERIFRDTPPTLIAFFAERVNLCKGRWEPDGSTATAYCWLVWLKGEPQPPMWIPPGCRVGMTKPDDVERFTAHPVLVGRSKNEQN